MARLITQPQIAHADEIYDLLVRLHEGLDADRSGIVNAKLILLLANHIGDEAVLREAIALARAAAAS